MNAKFAESAIEDSAIKLFERPGYDDIRNAQHLNRVTTFGLLAMDAWVFGR